MSCKRVNNYSVLCEYLPSLADHIHTHPLPYLCLYETYSRLQEISHSVDVNNLSLLHYLYAQYRYLHNLVLHGLHNRGYKTNVGNPFRFQGSL